MNKKTFKILLCIPPAYEKNYPPLGTPVIVGFLKSKGIAAFQEDLNISFFEYVRRNKLGFMFTKRYKDDKIKNHVYYHRDLKYKNRNSLWYLFQNTPGASFDFTEKLLSSRNLLKYIDDEEENIFHKFFRHEVLTTIKKEKFDMVGFSITAPSQVISAFTFGRIIKSEMPDVNVIIGGQWVSFFKEELIKKDDFNVFYDYIIYFEGETPLFSLINSIETDMPLSEVPNLIYKGKNKFILSKKTSEEQMNKLPCPNFDGLPLEKYSSFVKGKTCPLTFETSRGCYWNRCIFCTDLPLPKPRYREKDIKLLIEDIKTLKRKYKVKELLISSAVFSSWQMEKFSKELIKRRIKIKWGALARFEKEFTKELLSLAKKAGCVQLNFGLESMDQRVLDFCDKGTRIEVIKRIVKDAKDIRLKIHHQAMIGMPSETTRDAWNTIFFLLNYLGNQHVAFNTYYLIPKNRVFNNPGKYGIELRDDSKLPFRFFYPFRPTLGNIDRDKAGKIIEFYKIASAQTLKKKLKFDKVVEYGELVLLGYSYEKLQRYDKAIEVFKKVSKNFPNSIYPLINLHNNYFNLKKYDEAIKSANKVIGLGYKGGNIHFRLGSCYSGIGQYKKAIEEFKKAEKINPEKAQINFCLSNCYRNIGQIEQTNKELGKGFFKIKNRGPK